MCADKLAEQTDNKLDLSLLQDAKKRRKTTESFYLTIPGPMLKNQEKEPIERIDFIYNYLNIVGLPYLNAKDIFDDSKLWDNKNTRMLCLIDNADANDKSRLDSADPENKIKKVDSISSPLPILKDYIQNSSFFFLEIYRAYYSNDTKEVTLFFVEEQLLDNEKYPNLTWRDLLIEMYLLEFVNTEKKTYRVDPNKKEVRKEGKKEEPMNQGDLKRTSVLEISRNVFTGQKLDNKVNPMHSVGDYVNIYPKQPIPEPHKQDIEDLSLIEFTKRYDISEGYFSINPEKNNSFWNYYSLEKKFSPSDLSLVEEYIRDAKDDIEGHLFLCIASPKKKFLFDISLLKFLLFLRT